MMAGPAAAARRNCIARGDAIAHVMMLFAIVIFALNCIIGRWAVGETPPYLLGFVRWEVGMLILLPFSWTHLRKDHEFIGRNWKLLCLAGFLMPFMGAGGAYVALIHTEAINAGVLVTSMPVMMVLLSSLILKERFAGGVWLGIVIAISGVLYIVSRGDPASLLELSFNIGDLILIGCNLGLAGYGIAIKKLPQGIHPLSLLTLVCAVGALCHTPFVAYEMASGEMAVLSTKTFVSFAFVAVFPSVVAILIWNIAIGRIGPSGSAFYMYLTPVFAAIFAIPLLGETIGIYHVVGAVLIVIGVTLSSQKPKSVSD